MPLTVITGAASGMGAATRLALKAAGHTVVGVDIRDADVIADLSVPDGRAAAADALLTRCGGKLDHLSSIDAHTRSVCRLRMSIGPASARPLMSPPAANACSPPVRTMARTPSSDDSASKVEES